MYDKLITDQYNSVAAKFKKSKLSTMNDVYVGNEEQIYLKHNKRSKKLKILDIGCGKQDILYLKFLI